MSIQEKRYRANRANLLLEEIASRGRRFFSSDNEQAQFYVDRRGRVWFFDEGSGKKIYTHYSGEWKGFTHCGTLRRLISNLALYIGKGQLLPSHHLGPWPEWYSNGDPWAYGCDDMAVIRRRARQLYITEPYIDVRLLREGDDDGYTGSTLGYWASGHVDKQRFAIAANREFETASFNVPIVKLSQVKHAWVSTETEDGCKYWVYHKEERPGTKPITYAETD